MRRAPQRPSARRRSYRSRCRWMRCGSPTEFRRMDVCRQWSNVDPRRGPLCPCHRSSTVATAAPLTSRSLPLLLPLQRLPSRPCRSPSSASKCEAHHLCSQPTIGRAEPLPCSSGRRILCPLWCGVNPSTTTYGGVTGKCYRTCCGLAANSLCYRFCRTGAARPTREPRSKRRQPERLGEGRGFVTAPSRCGGQSSRGFLSRSAVLPKSR